MSVPAAALRKMLEKGLTLEDACEIAEAWEVGCAKPAPAVDAQAERRRAKDRERKREQANSAEIPRNSAEILPLSPTPPIPNQYTPSPPKGGSVPKFDADFERFWDAYPRKVGKGAARKAYVAAIRRHTGLDPPRLMAALDAAKAAGFGADPQFTPHATTWLNQERWEDQPDPIRQIPTHERPDPTSAKRIAREANYARALAGADLAAGY